MSADDESDEEVSLSLTRLDASLRFVLDAAAVIGQARRVLQYSHVAACFKEQGSNAKCAISCVPAKPSLCLANVTSGVWPGSLVKDMLLTGAAIFAQAAALTCGKVWTKALLSGQHVPVGAGSSVLCRRGFSRPRKS